MECFKEDEIPHSQYEEKQPPPPDVPAQKGRELKTKLYQLLIDGDYDFPKPHEYEDLEEVDENDPQHKSVRADYVYDDTYVHLACAATEELPQNTDISSRNYIELLWTHEFDEAGERMIDKSLTVYLDEVSGHIGHVERDTMPAGKYWRYTQKQLGITDEADFIRYLMKSIRSIKETSQLRSGLDNNQTLDMDEFNRLSRVLAGLKPTHRVASSHLQLWKN